MKRFFAAAICCLVLLGGSVPALAQVPTHLMAASSASAYWKLGPVGEHRVRYASAYYSQWTADGEVEVIAFIAVGTCRKHPGRLDHCKNEQVVTQDDYDPVFVMDPAMQVGSLELGPHQVQWQAGANTPQLTFLSITCSPDEEDEYPGPHLGRETSATGDFFGRHLATKANKRDYGYLGRGVVLSECPLS